MKLHNISRILLILNFVLGMTGQAYADNTSVSDSSTEHQMHQDELGHGRGNRPPGPPPEAIEACQGKSAGDACSFEDREGVALAGKCLAPPARKTDASSIQPTKSGSTDNVRTPPVACRPDRGPRRGESPAPD